VQQYLDLINSGINIYQQLDKIIDDKQNASYLKDFLLQELKSEIKVNIDYLQNLRLETFADFRNCKKDTALICKQLNLNCIINLKQSGNLSVLRKFDSQIKKVCKNQNLEKRFLSDEINSLLEKIDGLRKISCSEINIQRQKNPRVNIRLKNILETMRNISEILDTN